MAPGAGGGSADPPAAVAAPSSAQNAAADFAPRLGGVDGPGSSVFLRPGTTGEASRNNSFAGEVAAGSLPAVAASSSPHIAAVDPARFFFESGVDWRARSVFLRPGTPDETFSPKPGAGGGSADPPAAVAAPSSALFNPAPLGWEAQNRPCLV